MTASPEEVLRALADVERLRIAGALAAEPRNAAALAKALDVRLDRVRRHLNRLCAVGIVHLDDDRHRYRLDAQALRAAAAAVGPSRDPGVVPGSPEDAAGVVRAFFREGRLVEIPAKNAKRRVVLERLALLFEPGVAYPERRVNDTLRDVHEDVASLRRYLVDGGLLEREHGVYRRAIPAG